ncbi:acyl carrier protein [Alphaproteobacteria bacterium]|nr:acyl carrier protein [Alphaproteobacteria bacterium]GHS99115.1 acyl carrier protein [Alphaproteobacteria bacterium]
MPTIRERVIDIVKKHVKVAEESLVDGANLANDLGVDSLTLFEVILDLEKEFACEIPEKDSNNIVSIGAAVTYIESKVAEGTAK